MGIQFYHDAQFSGNSEAVENLKFQVFNDSDLVSRFNLTFNLKVKILKFVGYIDWSGSSKVGSKFYDTTIIKQTVDTCKVSKGVLGNFFIRMIFDNIVEFSNYKFDCPQEKGQIYAYNFPIIDMKYIPPGMLSALNSWEFSLVVKGKMSASKPFQNIFSIKASGGIGL